MNDYEAIQRRRNITVGIFVFIAVIALAWLIFKFGDLPIAVSTIRAYRVFVQFPIAQGVQQNTPVRFCGYQVGRVIAVEPPKQLKDLKTGKFYHQAIVQLSIDNRYNDIPSNVEVKLMTRGLGSSYIELIVDPESLPAPQKDPNKPQTRYLCSGMYLQGSTGMTSEFFPAESQKQLDELIKGLKTFISNSNDIIGDPNNKDNIRIGLANIAKASQQAQKTLSEFEKFSSIGAATMKNADQFIEKFTAAAVATSEEMNKTLSELRVILEKVNSGQGTAAKLVNDGRLYESLLDSSMQLQQTLQEMRVALAKLSSKGVQIKL